MQIVRISLFWYSIIQILNFLARSYVAMKSMQIREKFFKFFQERGHTKVASSSLIPAQDPTLLFANAGMNQFKDVFLGLEQRSYKRAVSIQKCMRAGGKHNDLDNVGFTKRHLTFFEMMGNFSFGDYFKKEALQYAWEFLTDQMKFDPSTIYASVYHSDDDSYNIWHDVIGLSEEKIVRLGEKDNFWSMGDTGPCGPCSEIYIDCGAAMGCGKSDCSPACSCDRFLEVWNMVFMQFDRQDDGSLKPLKQVGVDTGMGLERLCAIVQGVDSVFATDLFIPIIEKIQELAKVDYANKNTTIRAAFHVLADHIRSTSFLIADGCAPSNEGRGYVLRKIIRRAALFQQKLTADNIFPSLVPTLVATMGSIYPELQEQEKNIIKVLTSEIEKSATNLIHGQHILKRYMDEQQKSKKITGKQAFTLYDTYGFPLELTVLIAQDHDFSVDQDGFWQHMEQQREQSGKKIQQKLVELPEHITTEFVGYEHMQVTAPIIALIENNQQVDHVAANTQCWLVASKSPFYVEKGGQVSDQGWIVFPNGTTAPIQELKWLGNAIAINIVAPTNIAIGDTMTQQVDETLRLQTMKNHTATHLLQSALIQLLGKQIKQAGSLVAPDYLRFDFTYHENLSPAQIRQIEDMVNQKIQENIPVQTEITTYKDAVARGVIAFFGEKYNPESVRMVHVPEFSAELCGGTHVCRTGDIGVFKITEVTALSAGQRRIVAITGPKAVQTLQECFAIVKHVAQEFKVKFHEVPLAVEKQQEQLKHLQAQIQQLKKEQIKNALPQWLAQVQEINQVPFLCLQLQDYDAQQLKDIAQQLQARKSGFYFLLSNTDDRSLFYAIVAEQFKHLPLKDLATWLQQKYNLKGGIKQNQMQGGGPRIDVDLAGLIRTWMNTVYS